MELALLQGCARGAMVLVSFSSHRRRRLSSPDSPTGCLQLPGGHLEHGESWEECARREILEETGLVVRDVRFLTATNDVFAAEGKHYVTIFMTCHTVDDDPLPQVGSPRHYPTSEPCAELTPPPLAGS
jgi:ADP-ribose pyrophosphatase YjhB (NUDIX family)